MQSESVVETKSESEICCPQFDPAKWDGKTVEWKDKLFVKDHVISFLHIPLNFSQVITRVMDKVKAAGATNDDNLMLSDESLWGSDLYVAVSKEVPDATMDKLSGTFIVKVFEGDYSKAGVWAKEMMEYVQVRGKILKKLYFYYTTCPKCVKKYGKNYVVLFAQVS